MVRIEWREDMSVGVAALDLDHKQLLSIINLLEEAVEDGDEVMATMLMRSLTQEVRAHFEREERVLRAYGFPGIDQHAIKHHEMNATMRRLVYAMGEGGVLEAGDALAKVKRMFMQCLLPDDMHYKEFFERVGLRPVLTEAEI